MVAKRHVEVGQWVKEGDPIADIVQLDPLWVRVNVPEQVLPRLAKGDEARVTIDALGGETFTGTVDQILPEADPASRTFHGEAAGAEPGRQDQPGLLRAGDAVVEIGRTQLVVPKDAVVSRGPSAHVVAVREGKAVVVPVKRGAGGGRRWSRSPAS